MGCNAREKVEKRLELTRIVVVTIQRRWIGGWKAQCDAMRMHCGFGGLLVRRRSV